MNCFSPSYPTDKIGDRDIIVYKDCVFVDNCLQRIKGGIQYNIWCDLTVNDILDDFNKLQRFSWFLLNHFRI